MVVFYKIWKKNIKIELTKNKIDFNNLVQVDQLSS